MTLSQFAQRMNSTFDEPDGIKAANVESRIAAPWALQARRKIAPHKVTSDGDAAADILIDAAPARDPAKRLCRRHGKSEAGISAVEQPNDIKSDRHGKFQVSEGLTENTREPPAARRPILPRAPTRKRAASEPADSPTPSTNVETPDRNIELAPWNGSCIPESRPAIARRIGNDIGGELPAGRLLLLCCGHNGLPNSLHSCFAKEGVISDGFDAANGPQSDPADTFVFD